MATFDFKGVPSGFGVNSDKILKEIVSYGPLKNLKIEDASKKAFTINVPGDPKWIYTGTKFKYDSKDDPKSGIISGIDVKGPVHFTVTDIALDIKAMKAAFATSTKLDDKLLLASVFAGDDTFLGSRGKDKFYGFGGNDTIKASDGDDTVLGGDGNDSLHGQKGADVLTGEAGADKFVFDAKLKMPTANVDTITDFNVSQGDKIVLDHTFYTGLAAGALADANFVVGDASLAATAEARVVYNQATGDLYFDFAGGIKMYQFAHLDGAPVLTAADFEIV